MKNGFNRRDFLRASLSLPAVGMMSHLLSGCDREASVKTVSGEYSGTKPNIVFILIDDMGWKDLGVYGAELYETPNIDKLCNAGMKLPNSYTSVGICAPARATAMTGVHPVKLGMWNHHHYLPEGSKTFATHLKEAGYSTWHVGKWHCGGPDNNTLPQNVGFDVNRGGWISWDPGSFFWPYEGHEGVRRKNKRECVPDLNEDGKPGEYLTDRLADESVKLIEAQDPTKPFMLNLWHYAVHLPHEAKAEKIEKYKRKIKELGLKETPPRITSTGAELVTCATSDDCAVYAAMIESIDESVGRIVETLKKKGMYENTFFMFFSDNGPVTNVVPCVPLNGGKNSNYEGGIRMPAFITWPGRIKPGQVNNTRVYIGDAFGTFLDVAGMWPLAGYDGEGASLTPIFDGGKIENREFIWYFPDTRLHWGQRANAALMDGDGFKYIMFFTDDKDELYDVANDIGETKNIIDEHSQRAEEMRKRLVSFMKQYYKRMPPPPDKFVANVEKRLGIE